METKIQRMKELIPVLKEAGKAYYQESREIMSNFEYDRLYDELIRQKAQRIYRSGLAARKAFFPGKWTGLPLY